VRAGSRWPHFEKFNSDGAVCYMPYPFFMGYASTLLKKNRFNVLTLDGAAELLTEQKFLEKIIDFAPDLVLLEVSTVSIAKDLADAQYLKSKIKTEIVFAGLHNFMYSSEFLEKHQCVDYVIIGEYENILLELCKAKINDGTSSNLSKIKGLIFRDENNKIVNTGRAELFNNLDALDFPDRDALPLKNYLDRPCGIAEPSVQIIASRGCPFGCIFCAWPQIIYGGNKFRQRSVDNVISEMKFLKEKYKINSIYFDDDTFNVNKKFVQELSKKIISENLKIEWAAMCRADIMDEETLLLMKQSGLKAVKYGVESAAPEILKNIDKSLDIEKVINAVEFAKKNDIKVHLTFCFGLPGETKETIEQTINLACKLQPDSAQFSIATPFPGSRYYNLLKQQNRIITDDYSKYDGYTTCVIKHDDLPADYLVNAAQSAYERLNNCKPKNYQNNFLYNLLKKIYIIFFPKNKITVFFKNKLQNFFITWHNEKKNISENFCAKIYLFFVIVSRFLFRYKKYLYHLVNAFFALILYKIIEFTLFLTSFIFKFDYSQNSKKIKLVFISRESINLPGGRVRCHYFSQALNDKGLNTEVWNYPEIFRDAYDGANEYRMSDLRRIYLNLKFILKLLFLKDQPIVFMQRMHYHSVGTFLLNKYLGLRYIFDVDDWDFDKRPFYVLSELKLFNGKNFTRILAESAFAVILSSHYLYDIFKKWNQNVYLVQTVVYKKLFKYIPKSRKNDDIVFSWIGTFFRLDNCENVIYLIELFNELENSYPSAKLEIVGCGPLVETVISKIKSKNIKYIQWIKPDDMPNYLADIDVGLFPLWQNIEFNLGKSPTKLFEYMALGKISLSSALGEIPKIIEHKRNGLLANTPAEFKELTIYIIENFKTLDYIGSNARKDIDEKFCLEIQTETIQKIITTIKK